MCGGAPPARSFFLFLLYKKPIAPRIESQTESSYSLDLVRDDHGVLFADLVGGFGFVVVRAVMLVGVTVKSAEQIPAAAVKTWNATAQHRTRCTELCQTQALTVVRSLRLTLCTQITACPTDGKSWEA